MGCAGWAEAVSAWVDEECDPAEATAVVVHLSGCDACFDAAQRYRSLRDQVRDGSVLAACPTAPPPAARGGAGPRARRRAVTAAIAAVLIGLVPVAFRPGSSPGPRRGGATVQIAHRTFEGGVVLVHAGGTVTWRNRDADAHEIVWTGPSGTPAAHVAPGGGATRAFPRAGTYPYFCGIHPSMVGQVQVLS